MTGRRVVRDPVLFLHFSGLVEIGLIRRGGRVAGRAGQRMARPVGCVASQRTANAEFRRVARVSGIRGLAFGTAGNVVGTLRVPTRAAHTECAGYIVLPLSRRGPSTVARDSSAAMRLRRAG